MDDCNLKTLKVKPGELSPAFKQDVTEYKVTVASQVDAITISCETSDRGASHSLSNSDDGRTVKLKIGEVTTIKVEVTAESGVSKIYLLHVRRLSAKDAALSGIKLNVGHINQKFSPDILEYFCTLACSTTSVTVTPTVDDSKAVVKVDGNKPGSVTTLNVGSTLVNIEVTSPDQSRTQTYTVLITRKQLPRYVRLVDNVRRYECPLSLSVLYQPVSVVCGGRTVVTYSALLVDLLTRTEHSDPLTEQPLDRDWRTAEYSLDREITVATAFIPLITAGSSEKLKLSELGGILKSCNQQTTLDVGRENYASASLKHSVEVRNWEKQLYLIHDETNADKLSSLAEDALSKYFSSLPAPGVPLSAHYPEGSSPLDHLLQASYCYATAIKSKPKDASLHFRLGTVLEEMFYLKNVIGFHGNQSKNSGAAGTSVEAQESSLDEECAAICRLHGVPNGASLSLQLKAIDEEFHQLLDKGQSGKADHVQALFAWKSKMATQGGAIAVEAADVQSVLGRAFLKYCDTLTLDDTKSVYHYHVGRLLVAQGEFDKAVTRLDAALSWSKDHRLSRVYLGVALSLRKDGPGDRLKETVGYLVSGLEQLLQHNTEQALKHGDPIREKLLHADEQLTNCNIYLLRGVVQLGKLLLTQVVPKDVTSACMSAGDVLHTVALLASQALVLVARGNVYQQIEWILLDVHSLLLEQLLASEPNNTSVIGERCERLSALIKRVTLPANNDLLRLQLKTCQMCVKIRPCSSRALYLLGNAQMSMYDSMPAGPEAEQLLEDAKRSFRASISLEGQPASGPAPADLAAQKWWTTWKEPAANRQDSKQTQVTPGGKGGAVTAAGPARGGSTAASGPGRGGATLAAAPVAGPGRGGPSVTGRGGTPAGRAGPVAPATATRGGVTAAARGGAPARGAAAGAPRGRGGPAPAAPPPSAAATGTKASTTPIKDEAGTSPPEVPAVAKMELVIVNTKSYQSRLGLARVLARRDADLQEAKKFYTEVIDLAPDQHSAYIEIAELLASKDPMGAIDIYCRFPVSANPTFDDAYIFGEIVRLLFKMESYDDPRLLTNMIALGKVMGLATLEKYVETLEKKFKVDLLKKLYCGVNGRAITDPQMVEFFKMKCWM